MSLFLLAANKMGLENITGDKELLEKDIEQCDNTKEHCGFAGFVHESVKDILMSGGAIVTGYLIYQVYSAFAGK
jgi:hypothetical protein